MEITEKNIFFIFIEIAIPVPYKEMNNERMT